MASCVARPDATGNRALVGFYVTSGGTGTVLANCRSTAGTVGAASVQADTVQVPNVGGVASTAAANATDLATALTLVNGIKAQLVALSLMK